MTVENGSGSAVLRTLCDRMMSEPIGIKHMVFPWFLKLVLDKCCQAELL